MEITYKELLKVFDCIDMRTLSNNLLGSYTVIDEAHCLIINKAVGDIVLRVREEGMLNIKQASKLLGVSEGVIRDICQKNKLSYYGFEQLVRPKLLFFKATFLKEIQGVNAVMRHNSLSTLAQYHSLINAIDGLIAEYGMVDSRSIEMLISYNGGKDLESIAFNYGLSKERVRQIIEKCRNKRYYIVEEALKHYRQVPDEFFYVNNLEHEIERLKIQLNGIKANPEDEIPITDCDFSVRLYNCLNALGLKTIGDIKKYKGKYLKMRNFGKGSLKELKEHMKQNHAYEI
jgi:hypothetical protein